MRQKLNRYRKIKKKFKINSATRQVLENSSIDIVGTPLSIACRQGNLDRIIELIKKPNTLAQINYLKLRTFPFSCNSDCAFLYLCAFGSLENIRFFVETTDPQLMPDIENLKNDAIINACRENSLEVVKYLLGLGWKIDKALKVGLLRASWRRKEELIHYLLFSYRMKIDRKVIYCLKKTWDIDKKTIELIEKRNQFYQFKKIMNPLRKKNEVVKI